MGWIKVIASANAVSGQQNLHFGRAKIIVATENVRQRLLGPWLSMSEIEIFRQSIAEIDT